MGVPTSPTGWGVEVEAIARHGRGTKRRSRAADNLVGRRVSKVDVAILQHQNRLLVWAKV